MSDCRVPMPTYEPIGEVVDELKRKVDELRAEVEAKDARIRELEDESRMWLDGWAVNRITELEALVRSLYADYYDEWPDRAEEYYAERVGAASGRTYELCKECADKAKSVLAAFVMTKEVRDG